MPKITKTGDGPKPSYKVINPESGEMTAMFTFEDVESVDTRNMTCTLANGDVVQLFDLEQVKEVMSGAGL